MTSASTGPALGSFISLARGQTPRLTLHFFYFGIVAQKYDEGILTEYLVDPDDIARALNTGVHFNSGLLRAETLYILNDGSTTVIAEWRRPQVTGIWLEGSDSPIRVPLPALVLARRSNGSSASYRLWALRERERPTDPNLPLYRAPVPNAAGGIICWGSVVSDDKDSLKTNSLRQTWLQLLGSSFGNHGVQGLSQRYPQDIRDLYLDMEKRRTRIFPASDLMPARNSLFQAVRGMFNDNL